MNRQAANSTTRQLRRALPFVLPLLVLGTMAGRAQADQDVLSSDGQWKLHAKLADAFGVKKATEAVVDITEAKGGKACPEVSSVVFEMPAHGHGGDLAPQSMAMGKCQFHISDLSASMGGAWRLRLVLKSDGKTSTADFPISAK